MLKKTPFLYFFSLLFLVALMACGNASKSEEKTPFHDCQFGAPKPIFKAELPKVTEHAFQLHAQSAVENVRFDSGILLELIQSGCEKPKQEFQFSIPTSTEHFKDGDWIVMTIDMFGLMGNLATELQPFLFWQGALKEKATELKLGLPHELEKGFFVKIDKVADAEEGLLLVTLYQE